MSKRRSNPPIIPIRFEFYQNRPTLVNMVDGAYHVYAGDLRAHAAHDILKWDLVPCNVEQNVGADVMRKRAILDNTHRETWDPEKLADWEFEEEELTDMGVEWKAEPEPEPEPEPAAPEVQTVISKQQMITCPHCSHKFAI
jgi:hypothetical protein